MINFLRLSFWSNTISGLFSAFSPSFSSSTNFLFKFIKLSFKFWWNNTFFYFTKFELRLRSIRFIVLNLPPFTVFFKKFTAPLVWAVILWIMLFAWKKFSPEIVVVSCLNIVLVLTLILLSSSSYSKSEVVLLSDS